MKDIVNVHRNEQGFALIISMFVLVILTLIGIAATNTTRLELQIAGNDKVIRETFHEADGGLENSIEMLEQNLLCPVGFAAAPSTFDSDDPATTSSFTIGGIDIFDDLFALDEVPRDIAGAPAAPAEINLMNMPSDTMRTIRIPADPANRTDNDVHTNMAVYGQTEYAVGSAIQMSAGYEGKGKGAATGGGQIVYEIHSQHVGKTNSEAVLALEWLHLITGLTGCLY